MNLRYNPLAKTYIFKYSSSINKIEKLITDDQIDLILKVISDNRNYLTIVDAINIVSFIKSIKH